MRVRHSDVVLREPSVIESQLNNHDVKVIVCIMKIACCAHARAAVQLQLLVFLGVWLRSCLPSPPQPEAVLHCRGHSFHEDKSRKKPPSIPQMEKEEPPSGLRSEDSTPSAPEPQQKQCIWSVRLLFAAGLGKQSGCRGYRSRTGFSRRIGKLDQHWPCTEDASSH